MIDMDEKVRILLCEDDENLGMLLREYLQAKGYGAELYPDGEAGYKAFLKNKYGNDLVIVAVVTNSAVRYERLSTREIRPLTPQQACSRDYAEIENSEKGGPIAIADYYIVNNGTVEQMAMQFESFINWLNR